MTVATPAEVDRLRRACAIAAQVREDLKGRIVPGVETADLDRHAEELIGRLGGRSWFKGYRGYPATICVSVNEEVVHGIPGRRRLTEGDVVSLDIGVSYEGLHSDTAVSVGVGRIDAAAERLLAVTRDALDAGLRAVRAGRRVGDVSHAVQAFVESNGFSVVREFVGHGIGRREHEDPQIPNYGEAGKGPELVEGQALAIEPMVNEGAAAVRVLEDGWTAVTVDGRRSAHFEHTVLVTRTGSLILTLPGVMA